MYSDFIYFNAFFEVHDLVMNEIAQGLNIIQKEDTLLRGISGS